MGIILLGVIWTWVTTTLAGAATLFTTVLVAAATWWNLPFANKKWPLTKYWYRHKRDNNKQMKIFIAGMEDLKIEKLNYLVKQLSPNNDTSFFDKVFNEFDELKIDNRNTLEMLNIAYWKSDEDGEVFYVSPPLCDMWDCHGKDMMDKSWSGLVKDSYHVLRAWKESVENASQWTDIIELKNGTKVKPYAIHNKKGDGTVKNSKVKFEIIQE